MCWHHIKGLATQSRNQTYMLSGEAFTIQDMRWESRHKEAKSFTCAVLASGSAYT
jgi:hypothetical protein